jgi:hypothetical protein
VGWFDVGVATGSTKTADRFGKFRGNGLPFFFDLSGWPEKTNFRLGCRSTWIENPPIRTAEQADSMSATTLNGVRPRDFVINQAQKNLNRDVDLPVTTSTRCQRRAFVGLASASFSSASS